MPLRGAVRIAERLERGWQDVLLWRRLTGLADDVDGVELPGVFTLRHDRLADLQAFLAELGLDGPLGARCRSLEQKVAGA